ncbi:uncharacterized protein B0T23DRAFT_412973 [Neurospora hispaniola]|uniref:Uncharacterized protein n=1 Tax=Neurospora hispaniola TaxID=588809 RepID=A0AAJ0MRW0_9PEZI|nr:hypothetical protein B0T23DRAFT_412973 [Neurospora hispaniola]
MGPPFSMKEAVNGSMPPCLRDLRCQKLLCTRHGTWPRLEMRYGLKQVKDPLSLDFGSRSRQDKGTNGGYMVRRNGMGELPLVVRGDQGGTGRAGQNGQSLGRTQTMFFVDDGRVQLTILGTSFGK